MATIVAPFLFQASGGGGGGVGGGAGGKELVLHRRLENSGEVSPRAAEGM